MFFKRIIDNHITSIYESQFASGDTEITEAEYNEILAIIRTPREEPPTGKAWALRADTLQYELVDAPEPPEPEEEATEADYQAALNRMGVETE